MKQGWQIKKLGCLCSFERGLTYSKGDEAAISTKGVLRSNNVDLSSNTLNFDEIKYLKDDIDIPVSKKVKRNSILMCMSNGSKAHLGKVAIIEDDLDYAFGGFMGLLVPDEEAVFPRYFYYALITPMYKSFIKSLSDGANINNLKFADLKEFEIPVPSISEQQRIVALLDAEFAKIDALKANAEKNLQSAKDLFQAALKKELEPKEGWITKRLNDIYDVRDGTHDSPKYHLEGYPLVTSKNLRNGMVEMDNVKYISKEDYDKINERSKVDIGDVLFAMIGTIGNPSLVTEEPHYAIKNMALFKVPKNQSGALLRYVLSSDGVLNEMHKKAKGSNQPFVSLGYLRNFVITIPESIEEQNELVARLDVLSEKCKTLQANCEKTLNLCDDLKQALLRKAFNGEI